MKKFLLLLAAGGAYALWSLWGSYHPTAPLIRKSGAAVVVGTDQGDHALFSMGPPRNLAGCTIDYGFNSFGLAGGDLRKLGGRALLSYMAPPDFAKISAEHCATGNCMAGYLNEKERQGAIGHLLLIPESPAAMNQLHQITLANGAQFQLRGRDLQFQDGKIAGRRIAANIRGLTYFLVESIQPQ